MTYRVLPDGSIETSSLDEALALQQRIQERTVKAERKQTKEQQPTLFAGASAPNGSNGHKSDVVKKLLAHTGTAINSETMKGIIGAKAVAGVGPKLYYLRRSDPELDHMLVEQRDDRGIVTWKVRT